MITQAHAAVFLGMIGNTVRGNTRPLVAPMRLYGPTLTRTQASDMSAVALGADGVTWTQYAADAARYNGTAQRLLIEGARTNSVTNPRGEGASGATLPTGWTLSATRGLTHTWTRATRGGVEGVDWRMVGTPDSTSAFDLSFEAGQTTTTGISAALSLFYQLVAGTLPFGVLELRNAAESTSGATDFVPDATLRRVENVTVAAGTAYRCRLTVSYASTVTPVDCTVFLGWPQREMSATFASSAMLPVAGTPGASTRSADLVTVTLASLGLPDSGAGTYLWSGVIGQSAPSGINQTIMQIDSGSGTNRFVLVNGAGGSTILPARTTGGSFSAGSPAGTMTAGTVFRVGATVDAGRLAASVNGAAPQAVTGGPTSGLTTLRLGGDSSGASSMFGETVALRTLSRVVGDDELQALVLGMPV